MQEKIWDREKVSYQSLEELTEMGKIQMCVFSSKSLGTVEAAAGVVLKPSKRTPGLWTFLASRGHWKL